MLKPVFENPWVRAGALLGAVAAFVALVLLLKSVLIPLFFAFILAYIFDPLVDKFEARYKSRMGAVLVVVFGMILVGILGPLTVVPGIISQAEDLVSAAANPNPKHTGDQWLNRALDTLPLDKWVVALGWAEAGQQDLNPRAVVAEKLGGFVKENAANFLKQYGQDILNVGKGAGQSAAAFFASLRDGLFGAIGFLGNFVLFAFIAIYLLKDYDTIIAGMDTLIPPRHRTYIRDIARRIDTQLRGFMRGQLTVCVFLGFMYTTGLSIAGTPFAVPLGLFGGAASFIPYVGIVITLIPAFFLTLLQYGIDWHLFCVLITFGIAQVLEGNFITPKFVGEQVGLGPVWVILAIMVFSSTFGFLGLLLALPSAAVLKVFVEEGLNWYKKSSYFVGEAPEGGSGDSTG